MVDQSRNYKSVRAVKSDTACAAELRKEIEEKEGKEEGRGKLINTQCASPENDRRESRKGNKITLRVGEAGQTHKKRSYAIEMRKIVIFFKSQFYKPTQYRDQPHFHNKYQVPVPM